MTEDIKGQGAAVPSAVFTDSHAHLAMIFERAGRRGLSAVIEAYDTAWRAAESDGGTQAAPRIVDVGTQADDLPARIRVAGRHPWLQFSAGIWPGEEPLAMPLPFLAALEAAVALPECSAVGECGLDYHWMHGSAGSQRLLFEGQIDLAVRYKKPIIVHSRDAHADTLAILKSARPAVPVVIHCFGYDAAAARDYLELGCFISFAGNLTYPSASALREACALVPSDRMLLETDSPYMAPASERGKTCTPLLLNHTYARAASARGTDVADLARTVSENALRVFR